MIRPIGNVLVFLPACSTQWLIGSASNITSAPIEAAAIYGQYLLRALIDYYFAGAAGAVAGAAPSGVAGVAGVGGGTSAGLVAAAGTPSITLVLERLAQM